MSVTAIRAGETIHLGHVSASDERRGRAYRRALGHSRVVRVLRKLLPVISAAAAVGVVAQVAGNPFAKQVEAPLAAEYGLNGSRVTMQAPVLHGFKRDGKPYRLDATTAEQDTRAPNVVQLNELDARMGQGASGWVRMQSTLGVYDNKKETLVLPHFVRLLTDAGYIANLESADVELKGGVVRSGGPVDVTSPAGEMQADQLEVRDNGKEMVFRGRVKTMLHAERLHPDTPGQPAVSPAESAKP